MPARLPSHPDPPKGMFLLLFGAVAKLSFRVKGDNGKNSPMLNNTQKRLLWVGSIVAEFNSRSMVD